MVDPGRDKPGWVRVWSRRCVAGDSLFHWFSAGRMRLMCVVGVRFPIVHEQPPPLEQVRASIGRFDWVADHVGQRRLDHFPRVVGLLCRPVAEARPEAVRQRPWIERGPFGSAATQSPEYR